MKRIAQSLIVTITLLLAGSAVNAERLEIGFALTPTFLQDTGYEAFSENNLYMTRIGLDLRSEVANLGGFKLIPLISYRFAFDSGSPYYIMDTGLRTNDLAAGLRLRKGIISWLALFVEVTGGMLWAGINGSLNEESKYGEIDSERNYKDLQHTWSAGGIGGVEVQLSKAWLRSRGVRRFGFAGELAGGYVRRGDIEFEPTIEGIDDNAIEIHTNPWGEVNLSGWMIQIAASFRFF